MKNAAICAAAGLILASCGEFYQVEGHARVYGSSMYATYPADAPKPNIVYAASPALQATAPVRVIRVVQVVRQPERISPQEFLKNAPEPEPEPVVEDDELEPIPAELLEQPAGTSSAQVPAGASTL